MRNPVLLREIARWFNDVQRRRAKGFCGHRSSELDTDKTMLEPDFDPAPTAVQIGRCGYPVPCLAAAKKNPRSEMLRGSEPIRRSVLFRVSAGKIHYWPEEPITISFESKESRE